MAIRTPLPASSSDGTSPAPLERGGQADGTSPAPPERGQNAIAIAALAASLVPAIAGVVASAALLVDYLRPAPVFCSEGGGCDALRHTVIAAPLGIPLPLFGLTGFIALAGAALVPGRRARVTQLALAAVAGLVGAALLTAQLLLGKLCPYCCVADASGVVSAVVALWRLRGVPDVAPGWPATVVGAGAVLAAAFVPLFAGFRMSTTPRVIRDEMAATPAGGVTVVDFVDFECPFCRLTHTELAPLLERHKDRLRVIRRQVPLSMHPHARDAARAACCGEQLGQGDSMANALFSAPVDELTPDGCERIAQSLGVPLGAYRACVANPATDARIEGDRAEFKAAGGFALPTLWIGDEQVVGAQPGEALEGAIERALARAGS
jgi:uncharacterized membrane protein/predicted DsbA family dithiol-disulfide isomerase